MIESGVPMRSDLQQSNLDKVNEITRVLVASSVRYWRMELMRLYNYIYISLYSVSVCLFVCLFICLSYVRDTRPQSCTDH